MKQSRDDGKQEDDIRVEGDDVREWMMTKR